MTKTMRAMVIHAPMEFGIERLPVPDTPAEGFLLKVEACGLCGSDLRTLRMGHRKVVFPWVLGHEICGIVEETGPDYRGAWRRGERLSVGPLAYCGVCDFCRSGEYEYCENYREIAQAWHGGFADYVAVPGECIRNGTITTVPEGVDPVFAAVIEPLSSTFNAHEKANIRLGDTVVIIGAGPVGCMHAALSKLEGAAAIVMIDIDETRLKLAEEFGPDECVNAKKTDPVARVAGLTGGKGANVVISAAPAPAAVVQAVEMARKGGQVLLFGGLPKDNSKPGVDMNIVHYNGLHLIGTTIFAPRHFLRAMRLVASGRFPMDKLVTHRFPLDDFKEGAGLALDGKVLKAVFLP